MQFTNTSRFTLFTLFAVLLAFSSASARSDATVTELTQAHQIPQQASSTLTNAMRLARGLPLKAPTRRRQHGKPSRSSRAALWLILAAAVCFCVLSSLKLSSHTASYSSNPPQTGCIQVCSLLTGLPLGFIGKLFNPDGSAVLVPLLATTDALQVTVDTTVPSTTGIDLPAINGEGLHLPSVLGVITGDSGARVLGGQVPSQASAHYNSATHEILFHGINVALGNTDQLFAGTRPAGDTSVFLRFVPYQDHVRS
ncbi:hypothetical protein D9757_004983 [Collybiopsis confluens]|uniref:Uncharacterized protein n=1 Tax=Collybiopsis confluens TaxID=2823264 RepID=A0A8H5HTU0_9AGAR|nr:hypothetical protein D9757_004983 [Collybiopsis confluens]